MACQTNSISSQQGQDSCPLYRRKTAPFGESGGAVGLENLPTREAAVLVEMVVDGGMDGGEHPQTSHAPEPEHRPLASSTRQMEILHAIAQPTAGFLSVLGPDFLKGGAIGTELVRHQGVLPVMLLHRFPKELQSGLLVPLLLPRKAFQHLALVIDGPPKTMPLTVDLLEDLAEMPSPTACRPLRPVASGSGTRTSARSSSARTERVSAGTGPQPNPETHSIWVTTVTPFLRWKGFR